MAWRGGDYYFVDDFNQVLLLPTTPSSLNDKDTPRHRVDGIIVGIHSDVERFFYEQAEIFEAVVCFHFELQEVRRIITYYLGPEVCASARSGNWK